MKKICVYAQGMTVESSSFRDGVMPEKCTGFGDDISFVNVIPEVLPKGKSISSLISVVQ